MGLATAVILLLTTQSAAFSAQKLNQHIVEPFPSLEKNRPRRKGLAIHMCDSAAVNGNVVLPTFKYNAAPEEVFVQSSNTCASCKKTRGYVYCGPIQTIDTNDEDDYFEQICPWCIADGTAHEQLSVIFVDSTIEELAYRTPSYIAWQGEEFWMSCCDEDARYMGRAGRAELESFGQQALEFFKDYYIKDFFGSAQDWDDYFLDCLGKDSDTTAYVFQCMKCGTFSGFVDES
jgi:uncharacterized protein CbrC (UPF0167 family)